MKFASKFKSIAVAAFAVGSLVAAAPASAAEIVGTFSVSVVGVSADTSLISTGTTFSNTLFSIVGSATGDYGPAVGSFLTLSPVTATAGQAVNFTSAFGSFAGTVQTVLAGGPTSNRTVSLYAIGSFIPAGALSAFDNSLSSATFSFTQTGGANSAVSGSFSFATPPAPTVPEPASWALMIGGFGLVGGALRGRRALVSA